MAALNIQPVDNGVVLQIKVVPNSSKTAIIGQLDEMLKVKVAAPPEKGKANQCLTKFLSEEFNVKKNAVSIVGGLTNPVKHVQIIGVSTEDILSKLAPFLNV